MAHKGPLPARAGQSTGDPWFPNTSGECGNIPQDLGGEIAPFTGPNQDPENRRLRSRGGGFCQGFVRAFTNNKISREGRRTPENYRRNVPNSGRARSTRNRTSPLSAILRVLSTTCHGGLLAGNTGSRGHCVGVSKFRLSPELPPGCVSLYFFHFSRRRPFSPHLN